MSCRSILVNVGVGSTPPVTKGLLLATLALTGGALVVYELATSHTLASRAAPFLWLATSLFSLRVAGQVLVLERSPRWLPAMNDWNLVPYHLLLPTQVAIVGVMVWIDLAFTLDRWLPTRLSVAVGWTVVALSALYAAVMVVRYAVRMRRHPDARWFGGTIPIVFHLVLASYLSVIGTFHAAG
jgi:hypothetical protein